MDELIEIVDPIPDWLRREPMELTKHGSHDQSTHGRRGGGGRYTPTMQAFLDYSAELDSRGFDNNTDEERRKVNKLYLAAVQEVMNDPTFMGWHNDRYFGESDAQKYVSGMELHHRLAASTEVDSLPAAIKLAENVAKFTDTAEVVVAVDDSALGAILRGGRFKSQFETKRSNGMYSPETRKIQETVTHGTPWDMVARDRPIYGYLAQPDELFGSGNSRDTVAQYGHFRVVMKPSVRDRTSFTLGDSLGGEAVAASLTGKNSPTRIINAAGNSLIQTMVAGAPDKAVNLVKDGDYFEAQIHGRLKVSDIARVHIRERYVKYSADRQALVKSMLEQGIEVVVEADGGVKYFAKHLQGEHDQSTHGRRGVGGLLASQYSAVYDDAVKVIGELVEHSGRWSQDMTEDEGKEFWDKTRDLYKKFLVDGEGDYHAGVVGAQIEDIVYTELGMTKVPKYRNVWDENGDWDRIMVPVWDPKPRELATCIGVRDRILTVAIGERIWETMSDSERDKIVASLTKSREGAVVSNVTTDTLSKILTDGKFKNQFSTSTSGGLKDKTMRAKAETMMFELGKNAKPKDRPIYGFINPKSGWSEAQEQYGDVTVEFKDKIRSRTTTTWGDSLGHYTIPFSLSSPVPHDARALLMVESACTDRAFFERLTVPKGYNKLWLDDVGTKSTWLKFTEAQIHGDVTVADIAKVHFALPPSGDLVARLKDAGIEFTVDVAKSVTVKFPAGFKPVI